MKRIKRFTAMIMAAAMLLMFAVNVSAADYTSRVNYELPCEIDDLGNKYVSHLNYKTNICFRPTITPTVSGNARFRISGLDLSFDLERLSYQALSAVTKISVLYNVYIEYTVTDGRTYTAVFDIWQYIGTIDFDDNNYYASPVISATIPPITGTSYFDTKSITVSAYLYCNSSPSESSGTFFCALDPANNEKISMSTIIADST